MKLKDRIKWLFVTNLGRFVLGIILSILGVFTENGTIPLLHIDFKVIGIHGDWSLNETPHIVDLDLYFFETLMLLGILIIAGQFLYVVIRALGFSIFKK